MFLGNKNHYLLASNGDFLFLFQLAGIGLAMLYGIVCLLFIVMVVMQSRFYFGFYRVDLPLHRGRFIDDRFTYPWWILMLDLIRIIAIPSVIWVFQGITLSLRRTMVHSLFCLLCWLDIGLILAIFVMECFFCNNGEFRNSLCDTPNITEYCLVHWQAQPDLCVPPLQSSNITQDDLKSNPIYNKMLFFTLGFLALDFIISMFLWFLLEGGITMTFIRNAIYGDSLFADSYYGSSYGQMGYPSQPIYPGDTTGSDGAILNNNNNKNISVNGDNGVEGNGELKEEEDEEEEEEEEEAGQKSLNKSRKNPETSIYGDERDGQQGFKEADPLDEDPNEFANTIGDDGLFV